MHHNQQDWRTFVMRLAVWQAGRVSRPFEGSVDLRGSTVEQLEPAFYGLKGERIPEPHRHVAFF